MTHSGNKTDKTIISEELFVAVMRTLGLNVFYEHAYRNTYSGRRKIDFVVGQPYSLEGICYNGMVGVELKTRVPDLLGITGKSFNAFPFNYLLVTEDIFEKTIDFVGNNEPNSHLGIIVIHDNCDVLVRKPAEYREINPEYYGDLKNDIEEHLYEKYPDSVACAFAKANKLYCGTYHDFRTNQTFKVKYDLFESEKIITGHRDNITGTIMKKQQPNKNQYS